MTLREAFAALALAALALDPRSARADEPPAAPPPQDMQAPASPPAEATPSDPTKARAARTARTEPASSGPQRLAGIVAASGGLALVVGGGVLFGFATDRAAQIEDDPGSCDLLGEFPRRCARAVDAARLSDLSTEGQAFETSAWVMLGVGVAGIAVGSLLIVTAPGGVFGGATVRSSAGPERAALSLEWAF